ncbi:MAG TPA: hypothetical protein VEL74_01985, partial [Thermoanaerobaculia bacterium]|nr:hypothetical protein [Thermoanaerobaculia bacterium]
MRTTLDAFLICMALLLAAIASTTAATAQEVKFPLADYEALRARAGMAPEPSPPPAAPFALESADFDIRVGEAVSARVVQRLSLTLFADGWQQVPLGEAGSFIAADLGGLEGRVAATGESWSLHVRGKGRHEVRLESVVPLTRDETATRPVWRLRLRSPAAAVVRGRIAAAGMTGTPEPIEPIEEVGLGGAGLARRGPDGAWSFVARPGTLVDIQLAGRRTLPERARLPLRFETTSATAAAVSRTRLTVRSWIEARVAQGRL